MRLLPFILCFFIVLSSCKTTDQVSNGRFAQKRKYNPGYAWQMAKNIKGAKEARPATPELGHALATTGASEIETTKGTLGTATPKSVAPTWVFLNEDCDRIVFIDGTEKDVHVVEVSESGVVYKHCGQKENGDIMVEPLEWVHRIFYAKGTSMLFNDLIEPEAPQKEKEEAKQTAPEKGSSESLEDSDTVTSSENQEQEPYVGLSQLVAALLCFFLGALGVHRFYLGYTVIGIIQFLTGGCCGIWALVDFIRIVLGDLKPANYEDYEEKL